MHGLRTTVVCLESRYTGDREKTLLSEELFLDAAE